MEVKLRVELDDDAEAEEIDAAVRNLRAELASTELEVTRGTSEGLPPPGAKGGLNAANVLFLAGQAVAFEILADALVNWVRRRRGGTRLRIEGPSGELIELPDTAPADLRRLLVAWAQASGASS